MMAKVEDPVDIRVDSGGGFIEHLRRNSKSLRSEDLSYI